MREQGCKKTIFFHIIFIFFVCRIIALILLEPYIGLANNGDFQRLMSPAGLSYRENIWLDENREKYFFNYITNDFIVTEPQENEWKQVFSFFPKLAVIISKMAGYEYFDLRYMGSVNAFFYFIAVYFLFWLIRHIKGGYSYVLVGVFAFVLSDSTVIQYFNSFYSEIGSITSIMMLWCLLIYSFYYIGNEGNSIKKSVYVCIDSVVAYFAVLCKQQDILIVFPIVFIFYIMLKRFKIPIIFRALWIVVFISLIALNMSVNKAGGNITTFNVINKDLLANSENPHKHLCQMGFTEAEIGKIKESIGENAFDEKGSAVWKEYGDYYTRSNELKILCNEPKLIFKIMKKKAQFLFKDVSYLGNHMEESGAQPLEKTSKNKFWFNVKGILYRSNLLFYLSVIIFAISVSVFFIVNSSSMNFLTKDLFWIYAMLPCSNFLRYLAAVFGDGNEDIKHLFILNFEFDFIYIINICLIIYIVKSKFQSKYFIMR